MAADYQLSAILQTFSHNQHWDICVPTVAYKQLMFQDDVLYLSSAIRRKHPVQAVLYNYK